MEENFVVSVKNVSKQFVLPQERKTSVKSIFTSVLKGRQRYSKQQALNNISFDIKEGEFFGIVGRNGSGKSTLLKIIAGIYQPTKGAVTTKGKLVPFIELGVGFNPELTGRENVYLNGAILGFSKKQTDANYNTIVSFAELEDHMDQKLKNYSSGMQVRLAFACATMAQADILLVDEVLAVGDADFQRKCFDFFRSLKKQKKTVIFVTHDMSAVREYCDRAVLINDSRLSVKGSASTVADEYTKLFIETTTINDNGSIKDIQGNGKLLIKNIRRIPNVKNKNEKIEIKFDLYAKEDIERPVIGFKCKTAADEQILGTNNKIENVEIDTIQSGQSISISFILPNIFNSGSHLIDIVAESNSGDIYDWQIDALKFDVVTEKKTGYPVEVPIKVKVEKI